MELKDIVLSTLQELEDEGTRVEMKSDEGGEKQTQEIENQRDELSTEEETVNVSCDERYFCEAMRERILVLFEGFQSPNNKSIEAKVDLTLNFLEYSLAILDERLDKLDNR